MPRAGSQARKAAATCFSFSGRGSSWTDIAFASRLFFGSLSRLQAQRRFVLKRPPPGKGNPSISSTRQYYIASLSFTPNRTEGALLRNTPPRSESGKPRAAGGGSLCRAPVPVCPSGVCQRARHPHPPTRLPLLFPGRRGLLRLPSSPGHGPPARPHGAEQVRRAPGGGRPGGAAGARRRARRRRARVVAAGGVPGEGPAGDPRASVRGADIPVRRVQPRVLRRRLRLPRPPRAPSGGGRGGRARGGGGGDGDGRRRRGGRRRRLVQRPPPPHHRRHGRRQVHGRHALQQRLLRAGGGRGGGGDERPRAGAPLRTALPPQRHARHLRPLLRRARGPRDARAAAAGSSSPRLRRGGPGGRAPPTRPPAGRAAAGYEDDGCCGRRRSSRWSSGRDRRDQQGRRRRLIGAGRRAKSGSRDDRPMTTRLFHLICWFAF